MAQFLHLHIEHRLLAGKLGGRIVFGEGHLDHNVVAGRDAHHLFLEPGNEAVGAQFEGIAVGLSSRELFAVHRAGKIDDHDVPVRAFAPAADRLRGLVDVGQAFKRFFDLRFVRLGHQPFQADGRKIDGFDVREYFHRHGVFQVGTFLERDDLNLWLHGWPQAALRHDLLRRVIDCLFQNLAHDRRTVLLAQQGHRGLARTEPRNGDGVRQLFQAAGKLLLDLGGGNGDLELALQPLDLGFRNVHGCANQKACYALPNHFWKWLAMRCGRTIYGCESGAGGGT